MSMTIEQVKDSISGELIAYLIIDHGNGQYTSMLKSTYDEQQAEQSTPMVTDEAKTK